MTKTANYNIKKPEPTDPVQLADLNENADLIDAALTQLAGRLQVEFGSYVGNGAFGPGTQTTIPFSFPPKIVIVVADADTSTNPYCMAVFFAGQKKSNGGLTLTWGNNTLSWSTKYTAQNAANAGWQLNTANVTYRYAVIG